MVRFFNWLFFSSKLKVKSIIDAAGTVISIKLL
jgi:hypothetical protein